MRPQDLFGKGLCARRRFSQGLDLLALAVELFRHRVLSGLRLCQEPLEVGSLFGTLLGVLPVHDRELLELADKPIALGCHPLTLIARVTQLLLERFHLLLMRSLALP